MTVVNFQDWKEKKKSYYILSFFEPGKTNSVNPIFNSTQTLEPSSAAQRLQAGQATRVNPTPPPPLTPTGHLEGQGTVVHVQVGSRCCSRECPGWVSSPGTPQVSRSWELTATPPAGLRRGVSDSTTSLQRMESDSWQPHIPVRCGTHSCSVPGSW